MTTAGGDYRRAMPPRTGPVRFALLGDRAVAVRALDRLLGDADAELVLLGTSGPDRASHAAELVALGAKSVPVLVGDEVRTEHGLAALAAARPDVLLSVHFPYLIPASVLAVPTIGAYNLHPALLPHGRGWHTVSWALLEGSPVGCTLHRMTEDLDRGPIVAQREVVPRDLETADELYRRVLATEVELLAEAWRDVRRWPELERPQPDDGPPTRSAAALARLPERDLRSRATWATEDLIRVLRALTTNDAREALRVEGADGSYAIRLERLPDV